MRIPVSKPYLGNEEAEATRKTIESGWVAQGPRVGDFEQAVCGYTGAAHGVATTSCTTSLFLALKILGVGAGDEVIVPSLSFIASANSIRHTGATPVFCEVDKRTLNTDASLIEPLITKKTKAIVPVHQLGLPCDIDAVNAVASKHKLPVLEDSACALGSSYKGKLIGSQGLHALSFHPRKLITSGEGGMILTPDADFAAKAKMMRAHGMSADDLKRHKADTVIIEEYPVVGYNFRMTDVQAAMGIEQVKRLPFILAERKRVAGVYNEALKSIPWLTTPFVPDYADFNYQSYAITLTDDAPHQQLEFMQKLLDKGIATRRGVMAIHPEKSYDDISHGKLPVTEFLATHTVLLPIYAAMTEEEMTYVIDSIRALS